MANIIHVTEGNKCKIRGLSTAAKAYGTNPGEKDGAECLKISSR